MASRVGPSFLSPDGGTIAYSLWDGGRVLLLAIDTGVDRELALKGFAGSSQTPVAFAPAGNMQFSPDGTRLLFSQKVEGAHHDLVLSEHGNAWEFRDVIVPVIGPGPAVVLGSDVHLGVGGPGGEATFSPDGTHVLAVYGGPVPEWTLAVRRRHRPGHAAELVPCRRLGDGLAAPCAVRI